MPEQPTSLAGQIALVTGASSGIGRAIAMALAQAGADVIVHARQNVKGADATAAAIAALGRRTEVMLADLADAVTHEPLAERAWGWQGAIDILVNNAGADVLTGEAARWSFEAKLQRLWHVRRTGDDPAFAADRRTCTSAATG